MVTAKDSENKLSQVLWRCRRGMLELDMMLQGFCEKIYSTLKPETQQLFEDLLQESDHDLQRWLISAQPCEQAKFQDMLLVIRHEYRKNQSLSTVE